MAISQNFLTGRMRKSAGGTRFSTWKGLNIVAAKPISVRQNVTAAVQLNRNKMSVIGKMVSKINGRVGIFYNFGIQKTTPFADVVKFFRNRISDVLKFDPTLLNSAKFGTGNAEGLNYQVTTPSISGFQLDVVSGQFDNPFLIEDRTVYLLFVKDDGTKIACLQQDVTEDDQLNLDLSDSDFVAGDKIAVATKDIKFRPGADLAGKVKFSETTTFYTLTA